MNEQELIKIISEVIEVDAGELSLETEMGDFEKWDSIGHMSIILAIESQTNIRFNEFEFEEMTSIESMLELINLKL
tara:strand:- start:73 stop:300 length:228 start_codon:yes stop_codon:yes gene_type:complete